MGSLTNQMIGEYRVLESLGAGGMGEVYKAVHVRLGRVIAIKVLSPDGADGPALERFYSEASIQASLKHPGVAEYLGFYQFRDFPCILMEYVDGQTLGAVIGRRGALPSEEAVRILHQVTAVVAHFHANGVVHRDLKSANIKITADGRVKILDFGIARHQRQARLTRTGLVIGTPESLAPEQIHGEPATPATDVWQLGVLFYEMLTGRLPFASATTQETYARILSADLPPIDRAVPAAVRAIVARCLRRDPARRYPDAASLCRALDNAAQPSDTWRWLAAAAIVFVVMSLAAGFHTCQAEHPADSNAGPPSPVSPPSARQVLIDTMDGPADVFLQGRRVGATPYRIQARTGDRVEVTLRRPGFSDLPVQFDASERRSYTFTLEPLKPER